MITRFMKKIASKKAGLSPGTLIHIGEKKIEKVKITLIDYDSKNLQEKELEHVEESFPFKDEPTDTWLNISGLHDVEVIEKIGIYFNIHRRCIRHEFQIHARAGVALGISGHLDPHGVDHNFIGFLF